jgi:hypothetical protein
MLRSDRMVMTASRDDIAGRYPGFGALNLSRTGLHRECGGHEGIRLTALGWVKARLLLRRAGERTRASTWNCSTRRLPRCSSVPSVDPVSLVRRGSDSSTLRFRTIPCEGA